VLSLVERTLDGTHQVALVPLDPDTPVVLGADIDRASAQFRFRAADGVRVRVGPALDFRRLSDDHGGRLRFTGSLTGIHADDLVDAAFTADLTGFRLDCTPA
jgi:xylan 1,4-beta-xylosidase